MLKALKNEARNIAFFAMGAALGVLASVGYYEYREPTNREECLMEQLKDMQSETAVRALGTICTRLFPNLTP